MRFLSVCAGIEAASVAWHSLGWTPVAFSEIEPFPCAVLKHHYPDVQNWGDMTKFKEWPDADVDVLIGGTPCQSFSVAGLRKGLADPRGNLALTYLAIADKYRPTWLVWENVPGVLSSAGGRDFAAFLGGLGELGYGWSYRVLDAQYFGVAQRRRRVFVVGCAGNWAAAAAVLFERESLQGHPAPSREARQGAPTNPSRSTAGGGLATDFEAAGGLIPSVAGSLDTECGGGKLTHQSVTNGHVIGTITARMFCSLGARDVEEGALLPVAQPITFGAKMSMPQTDVDMAQTLQATNPMAVAQPITQFGHVAGSLTARHDSSPCADRGQNVVAQPICTDMRGHGDGLTAPTLSAKETANDFAPMVARPSMQVRRLTPVECERLQGFPDDYTAILWRNKPADQCPDGPRYKALGNSMAVPVIKWLGERIQMVNDLLEET